MINKNIILYAVILTIVSGCGFIDEIKQPTSFPKYYPNTYQNVDKLIKGDPLAEGENLRVTDVAETKTSIIRLVHIRKDAEIGVHTHENHDEIVYQVKGSGIAVLGGNQHPTKPGTVLLVPRGTPHSFVNGVEDSIALSFFSPPLEGPPPHPSPSIEEEIVGVTSNSKAAPPKEWQTSSLPIAQDRTLALPFVQSLNEIPEKIPPEEDVKTIELIKNQHASLHLVMVREDAEIGLHYHKRNDEVIYVVKGSGIIILHGTRYIAKPGSVMIVPRKSYHKFINTGGETYVALSLFSPPFTGKGTKYFKDRKIEAQDRASVSRPRGQSLRE